MTKQSLTPIIRFRGFDNSWRIESLSYAADIYDGVHQTPKYVNSGIMFLSVENIKTLASKKFITQEAFERDFQVYPQSGDILMTRIGDIGTANVVTTNNPLAYYVSLALLKPKGFDSFFLKECIHSSFVQSELAKRTLQVAFPMKINKNEIGKVLCAFPPNFDEQKKIGRIFYDIDESISAKCEELEKLENIKKACIERMFPSKGETIPQLRFKGFKDNWKSYNLNDLVLRIGTGLNPRNNFTLNSGGSNYYITIKNILHGSISLDESCDLVDDEALKIIQQRSDLRTGDILFSSIGRVGDCYLVKETPKNWNINESVFTLRPKQDIIFPLYLMHAIHTDSVLKQILDNVTGSTFKSIKISDLKGISIPVPTIDEQIKIADFIDSYYKLISAKRHEIEKLQNIKQSLLDKMFV